MDSTAAGQSRARLPPLAMSGAGWPERAVSQSQWGACGLHSQSCTAHVTHLPQGSLYEGIEAELPDNWSVEFSRERLYVLCYTYPSAEPRTTERTTIGGSENLFIRLRVSPVIVPINLCIRTRLFAQTWHSTVLLPTVLRCFCLLVLVSYSNVRLRQNCRPHVSSGTHIEKVPSCP